MWARVLHLALRAIEQRPLLVAAAAVVFAVLAALWLLHYLRRPTPDEIERNRRLRLHAIGRLTSGEILEMLPAPVEEPDGLPPLLVYQYPAAGVTYQVSQALHQVPVALDPESWIPGWPVQVKYDPANPGNSIVVCEHWSGLARRGKGSGATAAAAGSLK